MAAEKQTKSPCSSPDTGSGCCYVESVVSVDERGQMVLPKEIRKKANINPGDKLVIVSTKRKGNVCCLSLIKAQNFEGMVEELISPMMKANERK